MTTGIAAALLIFTGIWHLTEWLMGGRTRDTLALTPVGAIYCLLGYLLIATIGGFWVSLIAMIITATGGAVAVLIFNTAKVRKWVLACFIVVDVVIVVALLLSLFGV